MQPHSYAERHTVNHIVKLGSLRAVSPTTVLLQSIFLARAVPRQELGVAIRFGVHFLRRRGENHRHCCAAIELPPRRGICKSSGQHHHHAAGRSDAFPRPPLLTFHRSPPC